MPEALHERLRRLRRLDEAAARPAPSITGDLERLEESLLGERAPALSLKERLQRLVAVAERRSPVSTPRPALEDVAPGRPVSNARGDFFLSEVDLPIDHLHGDVALSRLRSADAANVRVLAGDLDVVGFDLASAVFLDTETTGLAGGSGTAAF